MWSGWPWPGLIRGNAVPWCFDQESVKEMRSRGTKKPAFRTATVGSQREPSDSADLSRRPLPLSLLLCRRWQSFPLPVSTFRLQGHTV